MKSNYQGYFHVERYLGCYGVLVRIMYTSHQSSCIYIYSFMYFQHKKLIYYWKNRFHFRLYI